VYNIAFFLSTPPQAASSPPYRYGEPSRHHLFSLVVLTLCRRASEVPACLHMPSTLHASQQMPAQSSNGTLSRLAPRVSPIPHQRTLMPLLPVSLMSPRKRKRSDPLPTRATLRKMRSTLFGRLTTIPALSRPAADAYVLHART
jgi:hypothetical protein